MKFSILTKSEKDCTLDYERMKEGVEVVKVVQDDITKLVNCYRNSLRLAAENHLKTVAFPCISTGIYGYPIEAAVQIAIREVKAFLDTHPDMEVTFCCFSKRDKDVYDKLLGRRVAFEIQGHSSYPH